MCPQPPTNLSALRRRVDELRVREQKILERAKREAEKNDKQALDLDLIDAEYPPSNRPWFADARQERLEQMEYLYYVCHPKVMTLKAFIKILKLVDAQK